MARYIERAENIARILNVNLQLRLDFRSLDEEASREHWMAVVQCTGDDEMFLANRQRVTAAAVAEFMVFETTNPNSIVSSICQARENARTARDQITVETWETLNRLYLFVISPQARQMWEAVPTDLFAQIKSSSLQLVGLSDATHLRNEGWWFSRAGRFVERADKTSRILDARRYQEPSRDAQRKPINQMESLEWTAILRSCSAWDAYKTIYGAHVHPHDVAEMLLLNEDFPRSVRFCVDQLNTALRCISGVAERRFSNATEKLAGRLAAELQFCTIEDVFAADLHEHINELQEKLNAIDEELFHTYIYRSFETDTNEHFVQQEQQQQQQ